MMSTVNLSFCGKSIGDLEPSDSSACSSLPFHLRIPDGSIKSPNWRCKVFLLFFETA